MQTVFLTLALFATSYLVFSLIVHQLWMRQALIAEGPDWLDILRGLSANAVFCAHLGKTYGLFETGDPLAGDASFNVTARLGTLGVTTFFLITGFLFFGAAFPRAQGIKAAGTFLKRRMLRLGPAFFLIAGFAYVFNLIYLHDNGVQVEAPYYLTSLVRLASFGALQLPLMEDNHFLWHVIYMAWSLEYEWVFYLLIALAMVLRRRSVLAVTCLLGIVAAHWLDQPMMLSSLCFFAIGGAYAYARGKLLPTLIVIGMTVAYGLMYSMKVQYFALALLMLFTTRLPLPAVLAPFVNAGKVTYSYYLCHGSVLVLTYAAIRGWLKPDKLATVDFFLLAIITSFITAVLSAMIYRYFEMPYFLKKQGNTKAAREVSISIQATAAQPSIR